MSDLYDALKLLRRVHAESELGNFSNGMLYRIAQERPANEDELIKIPGLDFQPDSIKGLVCDAVRLFSSADDDSTNNAVARRRVEEIELRLYRFAINHLKARYGESWWFSGVPEPIRVKAAQLYEESEGQIEKESALFLRDLKEILLAEWGQVKDLLFDSQTSKRSFTSQTEHLMEIRNRLSHPIRLKQKPLEDEDLQFLEEWLTRLDRVNDE